MGELGGGGGGGLITGILRYVVTFIMLYKVVLTFESVDKILTWTILVKATE